MNMKRYDLSSHDFLSATLIGLLLIMASGAHGQTSMSTRRTDALHYKPEHFVWARVKNDRLQRENLLSLLSRQQVVIVLEQPTDQQKRDILTFLKSPPATLPEIGAYKNLSLDKEAKEYAVGYLQDNSKRLHKQTVPKAESYLITFTTVLPIGAILQVLNDLTRMDNIDYALPVFAFPGKTVAPFIQFDAEFLAPELILGGKGQVQKANSRNYVKMAEPDIDFKEPVVLQLQKDAPTNILATVLRYQQMPGVVKWAKLRWLRVRQPVEIQSRWASASGINTFGIWEPIHYILSIERDQDVELLPKAFTEGAVYTWLSENTHLPSELIHVDRIAKETQVLEGGRALDEVSIWFRLSKTGTFIFAPYAVQAAFQGIDDQRRIDTFRSEQPTFLTIPGHLPRQLRQIPGELLALPAPRAPRWLSQTVKVLGVLCLVIGAGCIVLVARRSLARSHRRAEAPEGAPALSHAALKSMSQGHFQDVEQRLGALTFNGDMEPERAWLRSLNVYVKRLLGACWYQDESRFLGGLGTSSHAIRQSMQATGVKPDRTPIDTALDLVQSIEQQVMKQTLSLTPDEAKDYLARASSLTEQMLK